ncbi:MAG: hypothetical protein JWO78_1561 [Micavibrio sp.]|nr:hypothetical protein [Micavibrio sp.]
MQNQDSDLIVHQPEATPEVRGLKGKLKAAFTWASMRNFAKASARKAWDNKWETGAGMAVNSVFKIGAATLCTTSLLGSASTIVLLGVAAGAGAAATRYGVSYLRADEEARKNFSAKELRSKMLWGAGFGILGNTLGSYVAHHMHCFGGKLFASNDTFIATHKPEITAGMDGHVANAAPAILPPSAETAPSAPSPVSTPAAAAAPAPVTPDSSVASATTVPPAPAAPGAADAIIAAVPARIVPVSPLDAIKDYAAQHSDISARLKDALSRADSTNVRIRAQALDDIAVYAPKELRVQAYELLQKSASMGNLKARADLITMEFYGNKALGIKADPESAVDKMVELAKRSKFAAKMVDQWIGNPSGPVAAPVAEHFNIPAGTTQVTPVDITTPEITQPITPASVIDQPTGVSPVEASVPAKDVIATPPAEPVAPPAATPVAAAAPASDCTVTIDPKNVENLVLSCNVTANDISLNENEIIYIKRPAMPALIVR